MNVVRTFDIKITVAVEMTEQEHGQCVNVKSWENDIKDVIERAFMAVGRNCEYDKQ